MMDRGAAGAETLFYRPPMDLALPATLHTATFAFG